MYLASDPAEDFGDRITAAHDRESFVYEFLSIVEDGVLLESARAEELTKILSNPDLAHNFGKALWSFASPIYSCCSSLIHARTLLEASRYPAQIAAMTKFVSAFSKVLDYFQQWAQRANATAACLNVWKSNRDSLTTWSLCLDLHSKSRGEANRAMASLTDETIDPSSLMNRYLEAFFEDCRPRRAMSVPVARPFPMEPTHKIRPSLPFSEEEISIATAAVCRGLDRASAESRWLIMRCLLPLLHDVQEIYDAIEVVIKEGEFTARGDPAAGTSVAFLLCMTQRQMTGTVPQQQKYKNAKLRPLDPISKKNLDWLDLDLFVFVAKANDASLADWFAEKASRLKSRVPKLSQKAGMSLWNTMGASLKEHIASEATWEDLTFAHRLDVLIRLTILSMIDIDLGLSFPLDFKMISMSLLPLCDCAALAAAAEKRSLALLATVLAKGTQESQQLLHSEQLFLCAEILHRADSKKASILQILQPFVSRLAEEQKPSPILALVASMLRIADLDAVLAAVDSADVRGLLDVFERKLDTVAFRKTRSILQPFLKKLASAVR